MTLRPYISYFSLITTITSFLVDQLLLSGLEGMFIMFMYYVLGDSSGKSSRERTRRDRVFLIIFYITCTNKMR